MRRFLIMLAALSLSTPVLAQTQMEMNASADGAFHRADTTMAAQWRVTLARMKQRDTADTSRGGGFGYAAALLESQRAWLKFRDTECTIEGGEYAGGTMQGMVITQCRTRLTDGRTQQLHKLEWTR
jgi:uncharacterized protein YecT (DUF1311 family)